MSDSDELRDITHQKAYCGQCTRQHSHMSSLRKRGSLLDPNFARRLGELRWARRVENDKPTPIIVFMVRLESVIPIEMTIPHK